MLWYNGNGHWGWMAVGMVVMFLFWGTLIWVLARGIGMSWSKQQPNGNARAILDERYARGEITRDVYDQVKKDTAS